MRYLLKPLSRRDINQPPSKVQLDAKDADFLGHSTSNTRRMRIFLPSPLQLLTLTPGCSLERGLNVGFDPSAYASRLEAVSPPSVWRYSIILRDISKGIRPITSLFKNVVNVTLTLSMEIIIREHIDELSASSWSSPIGTLSQAPLA